jgi:hypothetical protein
MNVEKPNRPSNAPNASASSIPVEESVLNEDLTLALLKNRDLPAEDLEVVYKNATLMKSRKVRLTLAAHPQAPRRVALRLIREFYTFDLMHFSLMPAAPADLKRTAGELLVTRLSSITLGERIALARRSSALVAGALLLDKESQVWRPALENARLTEAAVIKALHRPQITSAFVAAICRHAKWSLRHEIRIALLQSAHTPLARALEFARGVPPARLRDILHASRLPEKIKAYLQKQCRGSIQRSTHKN